MKFERDLMHQIDQRLSVYELTGEVLWWLRINAGRVKTYYGSYLRLAKKGTPDYIALIRNRQKNITVLFIEAKSNAGKLRMEQRIFKEKYEKRDGFLVQTIREISDLDRIITDTAYDFTQDMPSEL